MKVHSDFQARRLLNQLPKKFDIILGDLGGQQPRFPGIVGFDTTVLPALERALLAGHDLVLLGERGQGKTRLIRALVSLLDEWTPVVDGCEINDDPLAPVCSSCTRRLAELGDDLPVAWISREERYREKLATPDVTIADLIGDIDPIKAAYTGSGMGLIAFSGDTAVRAARVDGRVIATPQALAPVAADDTGEFGLGDLATSPGSGRAGAASPDA